MEVGIKAGFATKALLCRVEVVAQHHWEGVWIIRYPASGEMNFTEDRLNSVVLLAFLG